jgi:mediator of RNA polymerase II transcription subunit 12
VVSTCIFEWSVTSLRAGLYRVYLGAKLLRYGFGEGMDIQTPLMEFMAQENGKMDGYNIYLLISELVRGQCFSLALYLRWLIAKGGVTKASSLGEVVLSCSHDSLSLDLQSVGLS